jgi:hypothetical protein
MIKYDYYAGPLTATVLTFILELFQSTDLYLGIA